MNGCMDIRMYGREENNPPPPTPPIQTSHAPHPPITHTPPPPTSLLRNGSAAGESWKALPSLCYRPIIHVKVAKDQMATFCSSQAYSAENDIRSFYHSANAILNIVNRPDETILMHLLYTNCVPILTYACAVKEFSAREMSDCNVALNDAIQKIFSFNRWESVCHLREGFGYDSIYDIFLKAKQKFCASLAGHPNTVISRLSSVCVL